MATKTLAAGEEKGIFITADTQYGYAEKCFQEKDFLTAMVEFKRFIHFFPEDERIKKASFFTGKALYQLKDYEEAKKVFNTLLFPFSEDPMVVEAYFMMANTHEQMGKEGEAERVLQNLLLLTDDIRTKDRVHATLGWIDLKRSQAMEKGALERAQINIDRLSESGSETYGKNRLKKTINSIHGQNGKNPVIAGIAAIVPGMGFLYCERYQDALVSFLLNTSLIMAAHESFDRDLNTLGGVICFVETGFFAGNIYGSISSAHKFNQNLRQKALESLEQDLKSPFQGSPP